MNRGAVPVLQLLAVLLSVAIEAPIVAALAGHSKDVSDSISRRLTFAAAATFLTHPLAWWINIELAAHLSAGPRFTLVETGVVIAETLFFAKIARWSWPTSLTCAVLANVTSFALGLVLFEWLL